MSDPLSFLPLALAAADGEVDGVACRQLVASGVALLQRTAPLVRALDGREAAILLPAGPAFVVALAACAGRAAALLDDAADDAVWISDALLSRQVGAVFTIRSLARRLPAEMPRIHLDDAPLGAEWAMGEATRSIDLALHAGLLLEGDPETEGSEEVALLVRDPGSASHDAWQSLTHRQLLSAARGTVRTQRLDHRSHAMSLASLAGDAGLIAGFLAPLLAGGRVSSAASSDVSGIISRIEDDAVTSIVAASETYMAIAGACVARGGALDAPLLQHCVVSDAPLDGVVEDRWRSACAVPLESLAPVGRSAAAPHDGKST